MRPLAKVVIVTYITHGMMPSQEGEIRVVSTSENFPLVQHSYKSRQERVEFLEALQARLDLDGMQQVYSEPIELRADGSQIVRMYVQKHAEVSSEPGN